MIAFNTLPSLLPSVSLSINKRFSQPALNITQVSLLAQLPHSSSVTDGDNPAGPGTMLS